MLDAIFSFDALWWTLMALYVPACIGLIIIVLLQKGKGTGFAGAFGAGAGPGSDTVFGPRMSQSLPVRMTYIAATLFMLIAVVMSLIAGKVGKGEAPELAQETTETGEQMVTVGTMAQYGIGTNKVDANRKGTLVIEAPVIVDEPTPPELEEGAVMTPVLETAPETAEAGGESETQSQ